MTAVADTSRPYVVVTGAASGIGWACTSRLLAQGLRVIAGVRRSVDGDKLRQDLGLQVYPIVLDISDEASVHQAAASVQAIVGEGRLLGLVNNAGVAIPGALELLTPAAFRRQLDVNVIGQLALTQALLKLLRAHRGRVVNIGSVSGWMTMPFNGAYAASKHALVAVTEALRMELAPWKIAVALIEPGPVQTPIWQKKGGAAHYVDDDLHDQAAALYQAAYVAAQAAALRVQAKAIAADDVAKAVAHALLSRRPKLRYLVGNTARVRRILRAILPLWLFERLVVKTMRLPTGVS